MSLQKHEPRKLSFQWQVANWNFTADCHTIGTEALVAHYQI